MLKTLYVYKTINFYGKECLRRSHLAPLVPYKSDTEKNVTVSSEFSEKIFAYWEFFHPKLCHIVVCTDKEISADTEQAKEIVLCPAGLHTTLTRIMQIF
jgi:hypothetical protein